MRFAVAKQPFSLALFLIEEIFVVGSPAAFIAFNYIVYGRMMHMTVGDKPGFTLLKPTHVSTIFVVSDVLTLNIQVHL